MPKGVEHNIETLTNENLSKCWISDAERRWAHTVADILSKHIIGVESLMPKGVEHWDTTREASATASVESLMPKGVEHKGFESLPNRRSSRVESLMPKGVEHALFHQRILWLIVCWISDAERRWAQTNYLTIGLFYDVLNLWCRKALSTLVWPRPSRFQGVLNLWCRKALSTTKITAIFRRLAVLNLWCRKALSTVAWWIYQSSQGLCWISDAERRWALSITNNLGLISSQSVESLMPKGVEHFL